MRLSLHQGPRGPSLCSESVPGVSTQDVTLSPPTKNVWPTNNQSDQKYLEMFESVSADESQVDEEFN